MTEKKHLLFSYGTLQLERVQLENYGRKLTGSKDSLIGYTLEQLNISDKEVLRKSKKTTHPIAVKSNHPEDVIHGMIFEISDVELNETDKYEVSEYTRVQETFKSGKKAWVYISKSSTKDD